MFEKRLVPRLGEFHTIMSFLSVVGKRFAKSGIEDILIEAGVVAQGSMNGVMSGHMYNRSVRAHKLLFEAFSRLQFKHFLNSIDEGAIERQALDALLHNYLDKMELDSLLVKDVEAKFVQFVDAECQNNPTSGILICR